MPTNAKLYEQDFYTWTQTTATLIRAGKWQDLDAASLAEEVESLGASDKRLITSQIVRLLAHLLKWRSQPSHREEGHSWQDSISDARRTAQRETRLSLETFPETCPWTLQQVLDDDFWSEEAQP
jgi:Domain of unknown function DUF29